MKKILISFFTFLSIVLIASISYASSDFDFEKLNFDATLKEDGSMEVVETWDIEINGMTNTLFKTFNIDNSRFSGITDVKVCEVKKGNEEYDFKLKNQEVYHVDKDCYYALVNSSGKFEIAWGINESSGHKTYKVYYKFNNCIKRYNDVAELYWQCIGRDFEINIDKITGTVHIPNNATSKEDIGAWAHGPLNGNIEIVSGEEVKFDLDYFDAGNIVEVRLAMPEQIFNIEKLNTDRKATILSEEMALADEANAAREAEQRTQKAMLYGAQGLGGLFAALGVFKFGKYNKTLKENPKKEPEFKLDYYRDIPDENATPAEAGFLYYFGKSALNAQLPKIFSATILDLALKQYITFETVDTRKKKEQIRIKVIEKDISSLKADEQKIYELLRRIQGKEDSFSMKDLEKYARSHYTIFLGKLEKVPELAENQVEAQGLYESKVKAEGDKWANKTAGFFFTFVFAIVLLFINWILGAILALISIICIVYCTRISGRFNGLTQRGVDMKEQWKGLKNYMKDYSMIDDREVPELVVWEKYLIYATVFGIADEVLKQLKVQYPELADESFTGGTYMGMMYSHDLNSAFIHSLNDSVATAYYTGVSARAAYDYSNSSSGSGHGGGFSGGGSFGGGGFGGGGRRRQIKRKKVRKRKI